MDSNENLAVMKVLVDLISFNLIYGTLNLELCISRYELLKLENKICLVLKICFDYEFGNLWYNGILTYLWEELREINLMEMIMNKFRGIMWNFSLCGARKALNYARNLWNSKHVSRKCMHVYELCMLETMKGRIMNYKLT